MEKPHLESDSRAFAPLEMAEASVPKATAVAACTAMAVFYVAILYSPTLILRLPHPTSVKSFMIRRFVCAAISSIVSAFASALLLPIGSFQAASSIFGVYGIRVDHLWQAVVFPLSLTSLLYTGSLVSKCTFLASAWNENKFHAEGCSVECIKRAPQRLLDQIQSIASNVLAWRVYVVAPFTEEVVFRACMIPLLLCGGFKTSTIVFLSPIFFSLAHLNHFLELYCLQNYSFCRAALIVGPQLGYTVIFGSYASFLFIRTGLLMHLAFAFSHCGSYILQRDGFACFVASTEKRGDDPRLSGRNGGFFLASFSSHEYGFIQ
ncbi:CAAX prenyl protease 2 isoform X2 [Magnolia sinica]|uniref:CAAX prenyl protease 2 isoform X2 n=1 Tax=Magnolia sinica TaxID=86752 RepID=UPI00265AB736|nr:CAAX prenyl protease 2 isoform X2 [Magnolia sinica]